MGNTKRKTVAARIQALLAKTVDQGCTEAEALLAASKAKELMDKYQINLSEAHLEDEGFVRGTSERPEKRRFNAQKWLAAAVANYCDCKVWETTTMKHGKWSTAVVFFGLRSDVEMANWLLKALEAFTWVQTDKFGGLYFERRNFAMGCSRRISERLKEEATARRSKDLNMSSGRNLVVVKNALVKREFNKLGILLRQTQSSYTMGGSSGAKDAGRAAGNKANFGRPVARSTEALRIGSR